MKKIIFILGLVLAFSSCKKKEIENPNEEELITTIEVNAIEEGTSIEKKFIFKDIDGPGGLAAQQFDTIKLKANKVYDVKLKFSNESVSPAADITEEVETEGDDHQIYFEPNGIELNVTQLNKDSKGYSLGTTSKWASGNVGKGTIRVTLKHKPGFKTSNDSVTVGETDVEIQFQIIIE